VIVYHVARLETAEAIEREGFRDSSRCPMEGGVWVSDRPLFEIVTGDPAIFEIEVPDSALHGLESIGVDKGYREWFVPATVLNVAKRKRIPWRRRAVRT
jgi:hypothetical protein